MLLKQLTRKERVSKIDAIAKSQDNQIYSIFYDYYKGTHFVKTNVYTTDYGKNGAYRITTRSGIELYDDFTKEDKVLVKANWCKPVIETIGDYTRGVNEDIVVTSTEKEEELAQVWKQNKINTLTHELAYEAGIFGKSFVRVRRKTPDSPIEILYLDPGQIFEIKNPITDERESVIYWFAMDKETASRIYPEVPMLGDGTGEVYYFEEWDDNQLHKYIDGYPVNEKTNEGIIKDINPYGFIPFVEVKANISNDSDISGVISLNDELNITLTNINEILKYHAFPMLGPKGTLTNDTPILSQEQLQEVEVSPRTIMPIPMERIGGEGIDESVLKYIEQLEKDISIVSGVPMKVLTAEMDGNLSGVALQRMMSSVIKQAEIRRNYIKNAYQQINNMILALLTKGKLQEIETDVVFPEMVQADMNESLDEALKKQTLGISKETIFEELGYDYKEENGKVQTEWDQSLDKRIMDEQSDLQSNSQGFQKKGTGTNKKQNK